MRATNKNPQIDNLLFNLTGKGRSEVIGNRGCMTCSGNADSFRDQISIKEYTISGMCQKCQDKVFG